jgi:hypothetical protein
LGQVIYALGDAQVKLAQGLGRREGSPVEVRLCPRQHDLFCFPLRSSRCQAIVVLFEARGGRGIDACAAGDDLGRLRGALELTAIVPAGPAR